MELPEYIQDIFKRYGWTGKSVKDVSYYTSGLEQEGYPVSEAARDFLSKFGGFVDIVHPTINPNIFGKLHFDAVKAAKGISRGWFEDYERRVGESLTVIGESHNGHSTLVMSPSGKVYAVFDGLMRLKGSNYAEALDAIYQCRETPEIK